jgi:hypothetical protein
VDLKVAITLAPLSICALASLNICVGMLPRPRDWAIILRSAKKEVQTLAEARKIECDLKRKKNPQLAIYHLQR